MQSLKRYMQQFAPSGNVGAVRADPGLADTGDELPWRGVEAAAQGLDRVGSALLKIQDLNDEAELSAAERQSGEYMTRVWNDIELEPDFSKHENMYQSAVSATQKFSPKSPSAARMFQQRMDQHKPVWDRQYYAMTTRRRMETLDSNTTANMALDLDLAVRTIEAGNAIEAESAMARYHRSADQKVEAGIWTAAQAELAKEQASQKVAASAVWADAYEELQDTGIENAEKIVMASGLQDRDKDTLINDLRYHGYNMRVTSEKQKKDELDAADTQVALSIADALDKGEYAEANEVLNQTKPVFQKHGQGDRFLQWKEHLTRMTREAAGGKDWKDRADPQTYIQTLFAMTQDPDSVTNEELFDKGMTGELQPSEVKAFLDMKKKDAQLSPAAKGIRDDLLSRLYRMFTGAEYAEKETQTFLGIDWLNPDEVVSKDDQYRTYQSVAAHVMKYFQDNPDQPVEDYLKFSDNMVRIKTWAEAQKLQAAGQTETSPYPEIRPDVSTQSPHRMLDIYWPILTDEEKAAVQKLVAKGTVSMTDIIKATQETIKIRTQPNVNASGTSGTK